MSLSLTIGDFARMTHLSVKALRHYHQLGLLVPAEVDRFSGYRSYEVCQVTTAQVVRRLRELDMPLDELRQLLQSHDPQERNQVIVDHLRRLEQQLKEAEVTVRSLRTLLEPCAR